MPIRLVDVKMTFLDSEKKPIHDEVHPAFELKQRPSAAWHRVSI